MARRLRIAVLVSGEGTTLEYLADAIQGGHIPATIQIVVADRAHAPAIEKARLRGLPTVVLPLRGASESSWAAHLNQELSVRRVELVVLAGFLSVVPPAFLSGWDGRVLNVHPSLLPKFGGRGFYGLRVHRAVLAEGERESGASVHWVTDVLDGGRVVGQSRVPVEPGDTPERLQERIRPVERALLAETLAKIADGTIPLGGG
ncbi:MAG TPA: phosphoribosylglycinamide formyltransferase [Thermoplasmata archaeon]|nr:phosphoribosylglycinamide formyltransferase [Thermoplasmata archaeon]